MAKYSDNLGFVTEEMETAPGIWVAGGAVEKHAVGDIISQSKNYSNNEKVNDDLSVSNRISIIAGSDLLQNVGYLRYAMLFGSRWKITSIDYQRPRLILTLGGLWNGDVPEE